VIGVFSKRNDKQINDKFGFEGDVDVCQRCSKMMFRPYRSDLRSVEVTLGEKIFDLSR
jgi:hypothetical protein